MRRLAILGTAVVVLALAVALFLDLTGTTTHTTHPSTAHRGTPGPTLPPVDMKRFDASGSTVRLQDLAGGKPMVVNVWSTSCVPCQQETPAIEQVYKSAGAKVTIIGVDVSDTYDQGVRFIHTYGATYPQVRDPRAALVTALGNAALPTTYLVDASGHIVDTHLGAVTAASLRELVRQSLGIVLG